MIRGRPRPASLAALGLLALYAWLGIGFARHASPTWDELPTFAQGMYLLRSARWDIMGSINHPPLSFYLQSLPLLWVGIEDGGAWHARERPERPESPELDLIWRGVYDVARGQALYYGNARRFPEDRLLLLSRLPTLLLGIATGALLFAWARRLHGEAGALLGLGLYVLSPHMIAHGALATTDMAFACFALASGLSLWRAFEDASLGRCLAAGLCLGLACLSKYTALLLVAPYALLLAGLAWRGLGPRRSGHAPTSRARALQGAARLLALVLVFAALSIVLGYQGHPQAFVDGVRYQQRNVALGQTGFLSGETSRLGWWYYYPFVMAVKTPLATLVLGATGLLLWLHRERLKPALLFATLPPLFLLGFFLWKQLPVGIRHVLPVYPLLYLGAGAWLAGAAIGRVRKLAVLVLLGFNALATLRSHPHELAYFNELVGGSRNGWRHLVDSNLDWGQDLKDLRPWMQERGLEEIQLAYFGTADPSYYGIRYRALPSFFLSTGPLEPGSFPPRGLVAISATCYWGLPWGKNPYRFLHRLEPIDRVGDSILVFDVP